MVVVCISRLVGELGAERGEAGGMVGVGCVAVRGAAVAVQEVRLVELPDLVPEGVLGGVAPLLLGGGADVEDLTDAPVSAVVGCGGGVGDAAGGLAEQRALMPDARQAAMTAASS